MRHESRDIEGRKLDESLCLTLYQARLFSGCVVGSVSASEILTLVRDLEDERWRMLSEH